MKNAEGEDRLSAVVGTGIPILAPLTSSWISLPVALVAMLVLAVH